MAIGRVNRGAAAWQAANGAGNVTAWTPAQQAKVTAWLRLQAATVVSGEYSSIPDQLASNPATSNSARRASVGVAANGLPIATFATNDCWSWPLASNNSSTTKVGFACWFRTSSATTQALWAIWNGTGGASAQQHELLIAYATRRLGIDAIVSSTNGREGLSASNSLPVSNTWMWVRTIYDSSQSTEATIAKVYLNGVLLSLTFANLGTGGTLGTLPTVTGNLIIGNRNDTTSASSPFNGDIGPNFYCLNADLTATEEAQLMQFEQPT